AAATVDASLAGGGLCPRGIARSAPSDRGTPPHRDHTGRRGAPPRPPDPHRGPGWRDAGRGRGLVFIRKDYQALAAGHSHAHGHGHGHSHGGTANSRRLRIVLVLVLAYMV